MTSILVPMTIVCEEHLVELDGEYDELRHRFTIPVCEKCVETATNEFNQGCYEDGHEDGYLECKEEMEALNGAVPIPGESS